MRYAWLALLLVGTLVLAGCTAGPQQPDVTNPFIGGTAGLAISFADGMPPVEIFDAGQSVFSVGVILENVGESGVGLSSANQYGFVELIGINPDQFGMTVASSRLYFDDVGVDLGGARRGFDGQVLPGDLALVEFPSLSYIPDRFGNTEVTLRANVCYEYRTFSDSRICFKDNVLENALDDTICTLTGAKQVSNSGGPVQVTSVTQNPAGADRIQVTFTIENLGSGLTYSPYQHQVNVGNIFSDTACAFNVGANPNRDVVFVDVNLGSDFGGIPPRCPLLGGSNQGIVRMFRGAPAVITCTIDTLGNQGTRIFTDSLEVDLHYTYLEWVETPILIRDTNVGFVDRATSRSQP